MALVKNTSTAIADPFSGTEFLDETAYTRTVASTYPILSVLLPYLENHKGFIAGGAFKDVFYSKLPRDIDIFFENEEDFTDAVREFKARGFKSTFQNDKAYGYKHELGLNVELIKYQFGYPEEILDNFDFSVSKFVLENDGGVIHHKAFFDHLKTKELVLDKYPHNPVNSWERTLKYVADYGYHIDVASKGLIVRGVQAVLDTIEDDQLTKRGASFYAEKESVKLF